MENKELVQKTIEYLEKHRDIAQDVYYLDAHCMHSGVCLVGSLVGGDRGYTVIAELVSPYISSNNYIGGTSLMEHMKIGVAQFKLGVDERIRILKQILEKL